MVHIDWSGETALQSVVADGKDIYQGHPTTCTLADGRTVWAVWTLGHGGSCGPAKRSFDGGRQWEELHPTPDNWKAYVNCPTIWRLPYEGLHDRLMVFAQEKESRQMVFALSPDGGESWSPMQRCGNLVSVMPFCSIIAGKMPGEYIGFTNARDREDPDPWSNLIVRSHSLDGGVHWEPFETVIRIPGAKLCEPCVIASPGRKRYACLMRANNREYPSMIAFSEDDARTWSVPRPLPEVLHGDRHVAKYLPDGRLICVFRNVEKCTFDGWVGRWQDLVQGRDGEASLTLLRHIPQDGQFSPDCGYPGLEVLADRTVLAVTYLHYRREDRGNSVVAVKIPQERL